jgi:hypothetical protein
MIVPILFVNNHFGADTLLGNGEWQLNLPNLFNRTGNIIKPITLMDRNTYDLNVPAYNANAPIYISTLFASKPFLHLLYAYSF